MSVCTSQAFSQENSDKEIINTYTETLIDITLFAMKSLIDDYPRMIVQNVVIEHHQNLSEFEVYACGSENMIQDAKQLLISNGLKSENFYSDAFVPSD